MIIGVVGTPGAGKDLLAQYLSIYGFHSISLSDMLRERIGNAPDSDLAEFANNLRRENGPGYLAELAIERSKKYRHSVITSIRSVGEAEVIKAESNALLVAVDADPRIRYRRILDRARETGRAPPAATYEGFLAFEETQRSSDPNKMNLRKVAEMADVSLLNDYASKEGFQRAVDMHLLARLKDHELALAREP